MPAKTEVLPYGRKVRGRDGLWKVRCRLTIRIRRLRKDSLPWGVMRFGSYGRSSRRAGAFLLFVVISYHNRLCHCPRNDFALPREGEDDSVNGKLGKDRLL